MTHLDEDALTTIADATDWRPADALAHLATCDTCRQRLHNLTTVHAALTMEIEPASSFVDRVMSSLPLESEEAQLSGSLHWLSLLVNFGLASVTTFLALGLASSGRPPAEWVLPAAVTSLLVGALNIAWNRLHATALRVSRG